MLLCAILTTMDDIEKYANYLGQTVHVEIDRPIGSKHPRLGFVYETNYGYVPETIAGDGHEIDAYVLGESSPVESFDGRCIAVVVRKDDEENKLIVANQHFEDREIRRAVAFVEDYYDTDLIRSHEHGTGT